MKPKDIASIAGIGVLAAIISLIVANTLFAIPKTRIGKIPEVTPLPTSMPDINHDPSYKSFLNDQALDPAQPVTIGGSPNNTPFNSSR